MITAASATLARISAILGGIAWTRAYLQWLALTKSRKPPVASEYGYVMPDGNELVRSGVNVLAANA